MTVLSLSDALSNYQRALSPFIQGDIVDEQAVLSVLSARDRLYSSLKDSSPGVSVISEIRELDKKLTEQANDMASVFDFSGYRQSLDVPTVYWWWFLDEKTYPVDTLLKGMTPLLWACSVGFSVGIVNRFLLGGAGIAGLAAIALPIFLPSLKKRGELTVAGEEWIQRLLKWVPSSRTAQLKFQAMYAFAIFCIVLFAWGLLPTFSKVFNQWGKDAQDTDRLGSAEQQYKRAISLDPNNGDAYYELGNLYEDIQDFSQAESQYIMAAKRGVPEAYNNWARLNLLSEKPDIRQTLALINQGLIAADTERSAPEVRYSLYKNLGWALYEKQEYDEAHWALKKSIPLGDNQYARNTASAYCLLAQTIESLKDISDDERRIQSLSNWQQCYNNADPCTPEENEWATTAKEKLNIESSEYRKICTPPSVR